MPGRMESVENLVAAAVPGSRNRGWFSTLPTAPWKSLRDSHSSTAPTMTILSYHQGDTSTGLPKGTFLLGLDTGVHAFLTAHMHSSTLEGMHECTHAHQEAVS